MFTFKHVSTLGVVQADGSKKQVDLPGEELSLPTTRQELIDLLLSDADSNIVKVKCGSVVVNGKKQDQKIELELILADYAAGRKLRSNQDQQDAAKGDGAMEKRADTAVWVTTQPQLGMEFVASIGGCRTKQGLAKHNAWLDKLYAENEAAIVAHTASTK